MTSLWAQFHHRIHCPESAPFILFNFVLDMAWKFSLTKNSLHDPFSCPAHFFHEKFCYENIFTAILPLSEELLSVLKRNVHYFTHNLPLWGLPNKHGVWIADCPDMT